MCFEDVGDFVFEEFIDVCLSFGNVFLGCVDGFFEVVEFCFDVVVIDWDVCYFYFVMLEVDCCIVFEFV